MTRLVHIPFHSGNRQRNLRSDWIALCKVITRDSLAQVLKGHKAGIVDTGFFQQSVKFVRLLEFPAPF